MRKIYLDAGAYIGDTVDTFFEQRKDAMEFEIFCFEPNPKLWGEFDGIKCTLLKKAVWVLDGEIDFYLGMKHGNGSTLMKNKTTDGVDYDNPIKVEAIDFGAWIQSNFTKEDYIVIKMDIEGAEFDVLEKMLVDGSMDYISELFVEFHPNKITDITMVESNELKEKLKELDLVFKDWNS